MCEGASRCIVPRMSLRSGLLASTFLASTCALGMVGLALATGVSQEAFELFHPPLQYAKALVDQDGPLRLTFTFDNLFLLGYATFFALFAADRWQRSPKLLVILMLVFGELVAVLDLIENHHILALLAKARLGEAVTLDDISWQVVESAVKSHLSYLGLIFAALIFPRETALGKLLALGTGVLYPLLGVAIFTAPDSWVPLLSLGRGLFFVLGLAGTGLLYARRRAAG